MPEIRDQRGEGAEFAAPAAVVATSTPPAPVISQPPAASPPMARLALAVTPWGEVYVDGKRKGVAPPLTEIRVAPGKHSIEIRNTTFPTYAQSVDLAANGSLKIRHKFQ
jgi:serine/threonine-protein kinase